MYIYKVLVTVLFAFICGTVNADLGDICLTPNNERATCKSIYDCQILLNVIRTKDQRQLRFLKNSQCDGYYHGDPLVCCGTDNNYAVISSSTQRDKRPRPTSAERQEDRRRWRTSGENDDRRNDNSRRDGNTRGDSDGWNSNTKRDDDRNSDNTRRNNGWGDGNDRGTGGSGNRNRGRDLLPSAGQCGFQEVDRIYGGTETAIGEFPWMALLQYQDRSGYKKFACGGSLISSRYILTAAHCVVGEIERSVGKLIKVRLGEHDTRQDRDCIQNRVCNEPPLDIDVQSSHAHSSYNYNDNQRYNDIALVRLSEPVRFSNYIRPICLPQPGESSSLGHKVTVAGWGKTERTQRSPVKLKVQIPIADSDTCRNVFSRAGIRLRGTQICAGGERGKDSCTGMSSTDVY
ncbi:unnamed protein product [Acanthoscelides obtectus]|uniref:CLIP domain-containing serine protease n=1 Tax=Acanthoscelides obtectus TaxID=200917 RepID=A0A9P0JPL0_ACAOB|nr:unnamed protein product [Acanthoscelides obtectus]CAK1678841.1 Phenoloxidase-activating factor 1 [Acanthoscelides obtectus]